MILFRLIQLIMVKVMSRAEFIDAYNNNIRNIGWVQSLRNGPTGIGYTFETLMGIQENNNDTSDIFGFEVKTHREIMSNSYVTLFTKAPNIPRGRANRLLLERFGNVVDNFPVLHASVFAHRNSLIYNNYYFRIYETDDAIMLSIMDSNNTVLEENIGWSKTILRQTIERKLKNLALISAEVNRIDNTEFFQYTSCELYYDIFFDRFIDLIVQGKIMVDIRLGTYHSGRNAGKPHDHGTGFRIKMVDMPELYNNYESIE